MSGNTEQLVADAMRYAISQLPGAKEILEIKAENEKLFYYREFLSVSESYGCYCDWVKEYHPDKLKEAGVWVEDEE